MKRYVVVSDEDGEVQTSGGRAVFTETEATAVARSAAKIGRAVSVYEEKFRYTPAEPDVTQAK